MRLGKVRHESKYLAIEYFHTEKNWSIGWMCKHLEVARAAYYKWLHRETPEDEMENIKLAELIKEYDERFSHILGYRRMTSWINHFNQTKYSKNRVHRIMKKLGIHSVIRKKKKKYRNANADETTQNILQRDFYFQLTFGMYMRKVLSIFMMQTISHSICTTAASSILRTCFRMARLSVVL